jgi:peptidyl-prolyl cis-trans isomerase C
MMEERMKKVLIGLMVCAWLISGTVNAIAETADPEAVVAKVNEQEILQSEVDFIINTFVLPQLQAQNQTQEIPEEQRKQFEQNIINQLITQNLLLQAASKLNVTADEEVVNQQLENAQKARPDVAPDQLKELIQINLTIQTVIQQEVVSKVAISDEEAQTFYDGNIDRFIEQEQVQASHILIMVNSEATQEEKDTARKKIEELLVQAKEGADFAELAKEHSEGPSNERGGDLGFFARGQMVKPFEDAAFALGEGEISDIIETQYGYHIIKATDRKPERQMPFDEVKDQIQQSLFQEKANTEVSNWIAALRENAEIEITAPTSEEEAPQAEEAPTSEEEAPTSEEEAPQTEETPTN